MRQAARYRSGPISPRSNGATVISSGRASRRCKLSFAGAVAGREGHPIHCHHIEDVGLRVMLVLAGVRRVEIGDAVNAEDGWNARQRPCAYARRWTVAGTEAPRDRRVRPPQLAAPYLHANTTVRPLRSRRNGPGCGIPQAVLPEAAPPTRA